MARDCSDSKASLRPGGRDRELVPFLFVLFSQLRRVVLFGGVTENVKGEALGFPLGCCLALCDESVQAYSDLSWLGLIGFGNFYFKYSVPIGCFDVIVFHGLR
jgi:hypothetical protein